MHKCCQFKKTSAQLTDQNGVVIKSVDKANYLGVVINSDCTLASHVQNIRSKMRARSWALIKLRQSGFSKEELVQIYCSYVRPVAEYAAVSWTSLITNEQAATLEKQQSQALKNVFGLGMSSREMRERADIQTLQSRREAAALKFAQKSAQSGRFLRWLVERKIPERGVEGIESVSERRPDFENMRNR